MTRSDMRTLFRAWVNDGGTAPLTTDAVFNTYLTRWFEDFAAFLKWPKAETTSFTLAIGTASYNLPSDFMEFYKVLWETGTTQAQELFHETEDVLDAREPNWRNAANGTPVYYLINNTLSAQGLRQIRIHPPPDVAASRTLRVTYVQIPAALTADSGDNGIPLFPPQTHLLGVMYTAYLHYIALNPAKSVEFFNRYLTERVRYKRFLDEARDNLSFGFAGTVHGLSSNPRISTD